MSDKKKTILIVDNDIDFIAVERAHLEQAGYEVLSAENTQQAQEILDANAVDMVIVEVMLEHMDSGFTLCYQIKKECPDMPVIILTGVAAQTDIEFDAVTDEEKSWIKADVLLAKPVRFEELKREVERLFEPSTCRE